MIHASSQQLASSPGEEPVAFDEKKFKGAEPCFSQCLQRLVAVAEPVCGPKTARTIIDFAYRNFCAHIGQPGWQGEGCSGHADSQRLACVEGIEPDAGPAAKVAHIRSEIQFQKIRNTGNRRKT